MRVWDQISPEKLCRNHLLAEHRETLAIWSILTNDKKGYRNHPEVKRWEGHLKALRIRHAQIWVESLIRGYNFKSLPYEYVFDNALMPECWDDQLQTLKLKGCECKV